MLNLFDITVEKNDRIGRDEIYYDAIFNILAYILFRIIKDNNELLSISNSQNVDLLSNLAEIAFIGEAPDIVLQLICKYSPGLYEAVHNSNWNKISPSQCNLFNEDV